jgi:hypothetical protein
MTVFWGMAPDSIRSRSRKSWDDMIDAESSSAVGLRSSNPISSASLFGAVGVSAVGGRGKRGEPSVGGSSGSTTVSWTSDGEDEADFLNGQRISSSLEDARPQQQLYSVSGSLKYRTQGIWQEGRAHSARHHSPIWKTRFSGNIFTTPEDSIYENLNQKCLPRRGIPTDIS